MFNLGFFYVGTNNVTCLWYTLAPMIDAVEKKSFKVMMFVYSSKEYIVYDFPPRFIFDFIHFSCQNLHVFIILRIWWIPLQQFFMRLDDLSNSCCQVFHLFHFKSDWPRYNCVKFRWDKLCVKKNIIASLFEFITQDSRKSC